MKRAFVLLAVFFALVPIASFSQDMDHNDAAPPPNAGAPPVICPDGTPFGSCSSMKPYYCMNGSFVPNCSFCGCDAGYDCKYGMYCIPTSDCEDGTLNGTCSSQQPLYCLNGVLKINCSFCGCSEGYECVNNTCAKSVLKCIDGTPNASCSLNRPYYCSNGNLLEKCALCGCANATCGMDGVCHENHPPVLHPLDNREINEGETLHFTVGASDPDGDALTFFVSNLPDGAEFDKKTGRFYWVPYNQTGNFWVTFAVVDSGYPPMGDQKMIRISVGEVNIPPSIEPIGDKKTDENVLLEFTVQAGDQDGDALAYYAEGLPAGADFNTQTGKFSWIPAFGQEGNYEVKFTVSDGKAIFSRAITITVGDVNRFPKAVISYPTENQEFPVGSNIIFSGGGSYDADGDKLLYIWAFGDNESATTENQTVGHAYQKSGTYNVILLVSDGKSSVAASVVISAAEAITRDADGDGVDDAKDKCSGTPPLNPVNIHGCEIPKYTNFQNNMTTDFSKTDLLNATDVVIGIPDVAKIEFRKNNLTLVGKNLNKYVEMSNLSVEIKTEGIPELNKSAVITFYNVTLEKPVVTKDSVYCLECKLISFENRTFVFSVPHFTRYSLLSLAAFSGYCGDRLCSIYETCITCSEDCGECKTDSGEPQPPGACQELWVCSAWSQCNELNIRTRECTDVNVCGTWDKKPVEATECWKEAGDYSSFIMFSLIIMVLIVAYLSAEVYRRRKESRKMDQFELERLIKSYVYHGYSTEEIKNMLKAKGYGESELDKLIKQIEKEIF
jgi:hypothetical protein